MNCEQLRDSFELYSLGLLEDGEEKSAIEDHLERRCSTCEGWMKDALAVQALLLSQAPEVVPPARLKRRVLGAVGIQPMGWTWFAAACAAAMLVVALWLNIMVRDRGKQLAEARQTLTQTVAERDKLQAVFQFLQEPETKQVRFGDPATQPPTRQRIHASPAGRVADRDQSAGAFGGQDLRDVDSAEGWQRSEAGWIVPIEPDGAGGAYAAGDGQFRGCSRCGGDGGTGGGLADADDADRFRGHGWIKGAG